MIEKTVVLCPYCWKEALPASEDHVFPQFLGGQREITCCERCNSVFGHTFEAEAARYLQPLHVFISSWGLPLRSANPTWKGAYVHEGKTLDLSVGEKGVKTRLARPVVRRDQQDEIVSILFETKSEAEQAASRIMRKGKAKAVRVQESPSSQPTLEGLAMNLQVGPALRRLAVKMCVAACTLMPHLSREDVSTASEILLANASSNPDNVLIFFERPEKIIALRPPVSHLVFVERTQGRTYGVVQFFGVMQLFCPLGVPKQSSRPSAFFGFLDPVTGNECFSQCEPLALPEPPLHYPASEYVMLVNRWGMEFREEVIRRGATHPPDLKVDSIKTS